jgi:hypothetical protein
MGIDTGAPEATKVPETTPPEQPQLLQPLLVTTGADVEIVATAGVLQPQEEVLATVTGAGAV